MRIHLIKEKTIADFTDEHSRSKVTFEQWLEKLNQSDWSEPGDIKETDNEILDKISTLLCAARQSIPGFTFTDEYRHGTRNSTGNHFHLSWSENGRDESRFTPKFCSSVNVSSLDSFEFPEITNNEIINK